MQQNPALLGQLLQQMPPELLQQMAGRGGQQQLMQMLGNPQMYVQSFSITFKAGCKRCYKICKVEEVEARVTKM